MNLQETIRRILREETESVKCRCGWSWKLSEGGDDPYVCHKCGRDNSDNESINEVYSSDRNEIEMFLSQLEFPLRLYRALIIEKGEKINKKDLGVHWTIDEYFARNLFHYDTFGGASDEILEDYDFYVITAEFNKDDIDFDETINKRLIKNSGHFWDELTGEFIENPDMLYHPYSHEDEIVIKIKSNPNIINIEKIDMSIKESIKNIIKEEIDSKSERIKSIVSKYGILKSFQMIAGGVETIRQAYNNDPYEVLKQYENLTPIEKEYHIEYIDQNGTPIFNYYPVEREVYISNEKIWSVLSIFNLKYDEIQKIISKWISKNYDINRVYPYLISDINLKKI